MMNKTLGATMEKFPIIKYACVGGVAFVVDWSVLYIATAMLALHYLIGATLGFLCGLVINYIFSVLWVFMSRAIRSRRVEVFIFTMIGIVGLIMNDIFLALFTEYFGIMYLQSKLLTAIIVFFWNYFARKYSLFHEKSSRLGGIVHVG